MEYMYKYIIYELILNKVGIAVSESGKKLVSMIVFFVSLWVAVVFKAETRKIPKNLRNKITIL